jgi:hypothetical protein
VPNPVEVIGAARARLAMVAAAEAAIRALSPALTAFAMALALAPLNAWTRLRFGYELAPAMLANLRAGLAAAAVLDLALCGILALIAWRRTNDYLGAAERVDEIVGAHQEIVTLATLTDPANPPAEYRRSPLFPILLTRAAGYLAKFAPERAFRLKVLRPARRGLAVSIASLVLLAAAMMALMRPPLPEAAEARKLREMARVLEASSTTGEGRALARALRDTAVALENPTLPPEQKLKMLAEVTNDVERMKPPPPPPNTGKSGNKSGKGSGNGQGESGKGQGKGEGKGTGPGQNESGKAQAGGSGGKQNAPQIAELESELSKTRQRIENESAPKDKSMPKPSAGEKSGNNLAAGANPTKPGSMNRPDAEAEKNRIPKPGENPPPNSKSPEGGKETAKNDKGSTKGDTHLGQFPQPVSYERFYKPGEHGPPIEIRDARYVVFRLPEAIAGGGGKTVIDSNRPAASTPYSNAPLSEQRLEATPEERQQVPPRYRELIQ